MLCLSLLCRSSLPLFVVSSRQAFAQDQAAAELFSLVLLALQAQGRHQRWTHSLDVPCEGRSSRWLGLLVDHERRNGFDPVQSALDETRQSMSRGETYHRYDGMSKGCEFYTKLRAQGLAPFASRIAKKVSNLA